MTKVKDFIAIERKRAGAWKLASTTVDPQAKVAAPYVAKVGAGANRPHYDFCLPPEFAYLSLLPEVRDIAIPMFKKLGISWHKGIGDGPSNHLLSSQVQCVNALGQMVKDPTRIIAAFGPLVGTTKVEEIEPGHYLTFEYIGEEDLLNEDESLHKWFKRSGPKGKEGGWVDCNAPDGKGGYKACGRKKGEKRAQYPSCRPTASQCKLPGKGKKWGKTK